MVNNSTVSKNHFNNVSKANEAFSLEMYTNKEPSKVPSFDKKSTDLFSGLNETVKVIFLKIHIFDM